MNNIMMILTPTQSETGKVELAWIGEYTRFENYTNNDQFPHDYDQNQPNPDQFPPNDSDMTLM